MSEPDATEALLARADSLKSHMPMLWLAGDRAATVDVNGLIRDLAAALRAATRRIADLEEMVDSTAVRNLKVTAELATLDNRFSCGHRKVDWDNSYGDCIACALKRDAIAYDSLPDNLVACHDRIEQLQTELAAVREAALEEAAKRCEVLAGLWGWKGMPSTQEAVLAGMVAGAMRDCAAAIRALTRLAQHKET